MGLLVKIILVDLKSTKMVLIDFRLRISVYAKRFNEEEKMKSYMLAKIVQNQPKLTKID